MSDELTPYTGHDIALPSDGGMPAVPDYSNVPATVRDAFTPSPYGTADHHAPASYQPGAATSGHQAFGVPLPAGVSPAAALGGLEDLGHAFRIHARRNSIDRNAVESAIAWVMDNALRTPPRHVERRHGYDLSGVPLDGALALFANAMHDAGVSARDFGVMMAFYANVARQAPQQRPSATGVPATDEQIEARCEADKQAGIAELQRRWGSEFHVRMRILHRHFDSLPQRERDFFDRAVLPGGKLAANDADVLEGLFNIATGGALPTGGALHAEISALEARIRHDRHNWNRDDAAQARLRRLYDERDGR